MKVVIIGGVAAGPKTGARIKRLAPNAEVTIIEKGEFLSYAGCGLPYYISGEVHNREELMNTPVGVVRDVSFFSNVKDINVLNKTEAVKINKDKKEVVVKDLRSGDEKSINYDKLVLTTGATPIKVPVEGIDLNNVFKLQTIEDSERIINAVKNSKVKNVAVVGAGLIGVEITEALTKQGCKITVVERLPQILPIIDWEMASFVEEHMKSKGVDVKTSSALKAVNGKEKVESITVDDKEVPCEMVIVCVGVKPNVALAKDAGIEIGETGAIAVNELMQTSDPDIYAAGDCAETTDLITKKKCFVPLGSTANKQGRVAANNICGKKDTFDGVIGSSVCKVFDFTVARTGLSEKKAKYEGFDTGYILSPSPDKPHFYPTAKHIMIKLVYDNKTRKLLGVQSVGMGDADKRVDVAAVAITAGMTIDEISNLDLCYAPPYSPAVDNILAASNIARNKADGMFISASFKEVKDRLVDKEDFVLLDVRSPKEYESMRIKGSTLIPLGKLRQRAEELPKDKEIITFCKISLRGYEAALILKNAGFNNVKVMDGGIVMWPFKELVEK